jgi:hypothetical protein
MRLAEGIDKRVAICDIETLSELFDVGFYNPDTKEWVEFEISLYRNQLFEFVKYYTSDNYDYLVTFNGISFDQQILQYIVDSHQKWIDLTNLEICTLIYNRAQLTIENSNFGLFPHYKERDFSIPPLDLFRIHHFDNEARRTSLKWCAFMLNMDVEEMPIHHNQPNLSEEDITITREYRKNDVKVTEALLHLTLGYSVLSDTSLADYEGKNKIQDRFDVQSETGMDCLNWSDVKIGEEWNKLNYIKSENISDEKDIFPKKSVYPYGRRFREFFPKTMVFTTALLQNFIKSLGNQFVKAEKQEFPITINKTKYTIAKGGLHSNEKNRRIVPPKGYILRDADVGGQYPNFIIKASIYPPHLRSTIVNIAKNNVTKRTVFKAKAKQLQAEGKESEARPLLGLQEMLKLCNNGGLFGKLGQKGSFLHYPEGLLKVCLGNEIEILMLIEMLESAGFEVVSGNTDGVVTLIPEDREEEYSEICKQWEISVGNTGDSGKLEFNDFKGLYQDNINSYIGKTKDGRVKKKGKFLTIFELNKNKSKRVIALALEAYFIRDEDPALFITSHKNIFDFCIGKKAVGKLYYEEQWNVDGKTLTKTHKKLVRYFISNKGTVLYKRGINNMGKPMNNHCEAANALGQPLITYFNKFYPSKDYNIDYNYYILEVLERIDSIEKTRKVQKFTDSKKASSQMSLFD